MGLGLIDERAQSDLHKFWSANQLVMNIVRMLQHLHK